MLLKVTSRLSFKLLITKQKTQLQFDFDLGIMDAENFPMSNKAGFPSIRYKVFQ